MHLSTLNAACYNQRTMLHTDYSASYSTWRVIGHEWAVAYLQRAITASNTQASDNQRGLRNAYLFLGPQQVGKSTLVRAFAKALLCERTDLDGQACGECVSCRMLDGSGHPDLRIFAPTDKDEAIDRVNGSLKVEHADELIHDASLRPNMGRYKVFLIQEAQLANAAFLNKILKTVEEPPDRTIICITATDRSQVLLTIVSRCEVMELRPIAAETIRQALIADYDADLERAELLARLARGRFGWAVRQLEDKNSDQLRLEQISQLHQLVVGSRVDRLRFSEQTSAQRNSERLFGMLEMWAIWWRDVLLVQNDCADAISNLDQLQAVERYASQMESTSVRHHLDTLKRIEQYLHHTVNTRLALDALLLDMPRPASTGARATIQA